MKNIYLLDAVDLITNGFIVVTHRLVSQSTVGSTLSCLLLFNFALGQYLL